MQPDTIGLALYDNPLGQLAWMGEKFIACTFYENISSLLSIEMDYQTRTLMEI